MKPRFDKPYEDLDEIDKEDNRAAARRILRDGLPGESGQAYQSKGHQVYRYGFRITPVTDPSAWLIK